MDFKVCCVRLLLCFGLTVYFSKVVIFFLIPKFFDKKLIKRLLGAPLPEILHFAQNDVVGI